MTAQVNNDEDVLDNDNEQDSLIPDYIELTDEEQTAIKWLENVQSSFPEPVDDKHSIDEFPVMHLQAYNRIIEKLVTKLDEQQETITKLVLEKVK